MVGLQEGLEWLLRRRFGATNVQMTNVGPPDVVAFALVDVDTWSTFAVVVDSIRIRSVQSLALMVHETAQRHAPTTATATIQCMIVFRQKCTLRRGEKESTIRVTIDGGVVECCLFNQQQICGHPLQFSIVPQDYRVVDPQSEEMARLKRVVSPIERLERMLTTDAVAHLLGFKVGDVVAHTSGFGVLPATTKFRLVVRPEN